MGKHLVPAAIALAVIFGVSGCASTVTSELRPQSLKEDAPYAEVTVMSGSGQLKNVYCPEPGGTVKTLKLVSDESTWGSIGKVVFMVTPYGWATMAAHSGKKAIICLPAGRVDLEVEHVQRRETKRQYLDGKVVKVWYRQYTWKQVITVDLKADGEYVLEMPDAGCLGAVVTGDIKKALVTNCVARLLRDDQVVASAGPPLRTVITTSVDFKDESTDLTTLPSSQTSRPQYDRPHQSRPLFVPRAHVTTKKLPPRQKVQP